MQRSVEHSYVGPRAVGVMPFTAEDVQTSWRALSAVGITLDESDVRNMISFIGNAMDAADVTPAPLAGLSSPSIPTPVQFLQNWLPGLVRVITQARKIDNFIGISTIGSWEDEEIVQGVLEQLGTAEPYSDYGNIPLSSWNASWNKRTVVRFEKGMEVGNLEAARSARVRIDSAAEKRAAAAVALEIQRNNIGFFGYNNGANMTYGFLNDPNLMAALAVPAGVGGSTMWSGKTFSEITADIRLALQTLRTNSGENIDPNTQDIVMGLPTSVRDYLTVTQQVGGISVNDWIKQNYPRMTVESAPQLIGAVGGQNVAYFYAISVDDGASDDSRVWLQCVPAKFQTLGVEKKAKSYLEDYTNATAGAMLKRPYAVVRLTGV